MANIGIYKITNTITNEIYIGASKNIDSRLKQHKKGNSSNEKLQNSIFSYGLHCFLFEILEECDKSFLFDREYELINEYSKNNKMFNSVLSNEEQLIHDKIISEFKRNIYNVSWFERELDIPQKTLTQAIKGKRNIPAKYFDVLIKELKL